MAQMTISRRQFCVFSSAIAGGLALGFGPADAMALAAQGPWAPGKPQGAELSAWIEIAPDDTVTYLVPTPEIGNGAMTQVAMNLTEELACAWSHVRVETCSIHRNYADHDVYQSGFLPFFGGHGTDKVRMHHALQLGASARERLKAAAAARWGVPVSEVVAKDSVLTHRPTKRTLRYGEVAAAAAQVKLAHEPRLKPQSEWSFIGKASPAKLDIPQIVTGQAVYGLDVKVSGMVHAALMQAPVQGGRLKSHDPKAVLKMPGVRAVVVVDPSQTKGAPVPTQTNFGIGASVAQSGVAVIADHYWQAKMALEALPMEWDAGPGAQWTDQEKIYAAARKLHDVPAKNILHKTGDVSAVSGTRSVEATYATPYCENAAMEPLNGTALVTADSAEVWCPTQDLRQAFWVTVDETGFHPHQVKIHGAYVGGAYGRRTQSDDIRMVVAVAQQYPGVPVKVIWSREECFRQGRYRTPITTRFQAKLGEDGYPLAVTGRLAFVGTNPLFQLTQGYGDPPYFTSGIIPNLDIGTNAFSVSIHDGAYRGPCFNANAFIVETFIDECAHAAGIDPLEYRLKLVSRWDKSWSDCLRVAATKAGWGRKLPKGEGLGIAVTSWPRADLHNTGTMICAVAHVAVSKAGKLSVKQVDVAFDCGRVANHDAVLAQLEGGTLFGLNMTLNEEVTVKDGAIVQSNFDTYPMLRMGDDLPTINIHFDALSGLDRYDIIGEAPVAPVGPAVGNAIFQATGKRLRTTPFRKHDLSWS